MADNLRRETLTILNENLSWDKEGCIKTSYKWTILILEKPPLKGVP